MGRLWVFGICFVWFTGLAQQETITFAYNPKCYLKTANDTLLSIYAKQANLKPENPDNEFYAGKLIAAGSAKVTSIPVFRIDYYAFTNYDGSAPIEDYIVFEERLKYQLVYVSVNNIAIGNISVPDLNYEMDRYYPGLDMVGGQKNYYANRLLFRKQYQSEIFALISKNPRHFYFKILGLEDYLFDIDANDHLIYAQYVGTCGCILPYDMTLEQYQRVQKSRSTRTRINKYVIENIGVARIKQIAVAMYTDMLDFPKLQMGEIVEPKSIPEGKKVFAKLISD